MISTTRKQASVFGLALLEERLHLDFSRVGGTIEKPEENFNNYCNVALNDFMDVHGEYYPEDSREAFYTAEDAGLRIIMQSWGWDLARMEEV